ncbi:hypothetical protein QQ045_018840 [Rhodiola kirilowii]
MKDGDNNTKYFHAKANSRRKTNIIMHLINSDGVLCEDQRDIHRIAKEYFEDIFKSKFALTDTELEAALNHVPKRVTFSQNALLTQPYTEREITEALFQLCPSKAPRLDGFHAGFYQSNWSTLKHDFITSCLVALNDSIILPHVNDTLIVLLPKQKNANKMEQFRPISLTTVIAKTVAKAIVNRLQQILSEVISPQQTTFIKGILDKFWSKTQGWSTRQLSIGGREVLIKSVLEAIPLYYMNCFLLPETVRKKLQSYLHKFWWGGFTKDHPVYWVKKSVLLDNRENGGMGFRRLKCVNLAFLAKQCWRIIQQPDLLLSKILKARYFHDSDFWHARVGYRPLSGWRSLLKARDVLIGASVFNADGSVVWSKSSSGSLDIKSAAFE